MLPALSAISTGFFPAVGILASSHDIPPDIQTPLHPSMRSQLGITATTGEALGNRLFHGLAPHPPRGRRYIDNPISLDLTGIPHAARDVQTDFLTADLKLTADGRMVLLEFNGLNSGLTGYERLYPNHDPEARDLRQIFFEVLSRAGHPLIWLEPNQMPFERELYTVMHSRPAWLIGKEQWLAAGAESMSVTDFVRKYTPEKYLLQYAMLSLGDLFEEPLDKARFVSCLKPLVSDGFLSADDVEALFEKQVETGDILGGDWLMETLAEYVNKVPSPYRKDTPSQDSVMPFVLATDVIYEWRDYRIAFISNIGEAMSASKIAFASLFTGPAADFHPKTIQFKRSEYDRLDITEVLAQLSSPLITLKATQLARGDGIVHLRREDLAATLTYLFRNAEDVDRDTKARIVAWTISGKGLTPPWKKLPLQYGPGDAHRRLSLRIGMSEVHNFRSGVYGDDFLLQEYVPSRPVHSPGTGLSYDGTMRLAFGLVRKGATAYFYPLDAYWKLPQRALGTDLRGHENSDTRRGGSLPVSEADYQLVVRQMTEALRLIYPRVLQAEIQAEES